MSNPFLDSLYVFIMAGGSGERFWPMSRARTPKHLLRLLSDRTLLEETVRRVEGLVPLDRIFILTNKAQADACCDALPFLPVSQIICEPAKRDTAPAAALATGLARAKDPNAICALLPADSTIHDTDAFRRQLSDAAVTAAGTDALLTVSIPPTHPSTGFGYLELGRSLGTAPGGSQVVEVARFVEKPDSDTAEEYVRSGHYGWNAGMFVWKSEVFLHECRRNQPALADFINSFPAAGISSYLETHFPTLPKISVDYAIMERAERVIALLAAFDWDDVGTWTALPAHLGMDAKENTLRGANAVIDSHHNIVIANSRTVALCGVSDLVVVETPDAVLVCHRGAVQQIKNLQPLLPEELR